MGGHVGNTTTFLIETLFGLYMLIVMMRFLLQWARADFYNPVSQFLVKATQPVLGPIRKIVPGLGGLDVASLVLLFVLQFAMLWIKTAILGQAAGLAGLAVLAVAEVIALAVKVFIFAIIIQVVLSWISPGTYNPVTSLIHSLTEPVLRPARQLLPDMGGLDLSPLLVLLALQVILMLPVAIIRDFAFSLM